MNKFQKLKWLSLGIAISVVFSLTITDGLAANLSKTATLVYKSINITLDGTTVNPTDANGNYVEPFIIDGTTYLPVRAVGNALGVDVNWDGNTNTVQLSTPHTINGTLVYQDNNVDIRFVKCQHANNSSLSYYAAVFSVTNKTSSELTFQSNSLAFNGISYNYISGSDSVAPKSTGNISFDTSWSHPDDTLPTTGITKISGIIKVIDFSQDIFSDQYVYEAKFVDITA